MSLPPLPDVSVPDGSSRFNVPAGAGFVAWFAALKASINVLAVEVQNRTITSARALFVGNDDARLPALIAERAGWAHLGIDGSGQIIDGVRTDGTHYFRSIDSPGLLSTTDPRLPQTIPDIRGWTHIVRDGSDNLLSGIKADGTHWFRSIEAPDMGLLPRKIAVMGDSMSGDHGGLGVSTATVLRAYFGAGVEVHAGGIPGQTSTEVALRQGGLDVFVTLPGNSIPASGAVAATLYIPAGAAWQTGESWTFTGTLEGVPGTLTKAANTNAWTFTRTTPGPSVPLRPETRWTADGLARTSWVHIIRAGRNATDASEASIVAHYRAMMEALTGANRDRVLALPIYNVASEIPGTYGYELVTRMNARLAEAAGSRWYDIRRWMIQHGLSAAGITPTPADLQAIAEDRMPPSFWYSPTDSTHLNAIGRTIEGQRLGDIIKSKGHIR